jgi:hypothetical protein
MNFSKIRRFLMNITGTSVSLASLCFLAACGAAEVRVQQARVPATNADQTAAVVRDAQRGAQIVAVPITKISIQPAASGATPTNVRAAGAADTNASFAVGGRDGRQYRVAITPEETGSSEDSFLVIPRNDFTSRNDLKITRFGNTDIPSVVENEFTDQTLLRIQQAGQVAAAVASVVVAVAAAPASPVASTSESRPTCPSGKALAAFSISIRELAPSSSFLPVPGQDCFEYQVSATQNSGPAETVSRTEFRRLFFGTGQAAGVWPIPACRDVTLTVRREGGSTVLTTQLRIADPSLLRLMPLPQKGKIALDPICGADLTDAPGDVWKTRTAVIEELAKQIKAGLNGWKEK